MGTPEGWATRTIEEVAEVIGGGTPRRNRPDFWTGGIPWATPTDITGNRGRYLRSTSSEISPAGLSESAAQLLPAGTILLTSRATIGASAIAAFPVATNQGFQNLVPREGLETEFLYYAAQNVVPELVRRAAGSTFLEISRGAVRTTPLLVPPLGEQRKIAAILSSVDETIEKTEAVIEQLQVVKKAMMQELLTRGMPGRHARFKQTEIGEIPESWEVVPLELLTERITYGFTNPMPTTSAGPWMLTAQNVRQGWIDWNTARHTDQDAFDSQLTDKSRPRVGDVLITKDGTLGRVALLDRGGCCINQSVALLRSNPELVVPAFLAWSLGAPHMQERILGDAGGSTIKHIYISKLAKTPIAWPPIEEQNTIVSRLDALQEEDARERVVLAGLRSCKNALASSLLSGDLRVTPDDSAEAPPPA